jgi:hypothetical protein
VLVTNKDGSQSVVTVNKELGMKAGDKEDIRRRLAQQVKKLPTNTYICILCYFNGK